jgi:hypothetical protein
VYLSIIKFCKEQITEESEVHWKTTLITSKPMEMTNTKQQTALQQLKSTIKDGIGNMNGQLNDYKSGYKQCLIDIENLIDKQLLKMEKERMIEFAREVLMEAYATVEGNVTTELTIQEYYEKTYGGNK